MGIALWLIGCLFWVPVMYLTFTAFWRTARMFVVLALGACGVLTAWIYVKDYASLITLAYLVCALVWPLWLAWDVYQSRNVDRHSAEQAKPYPRLTPEDAKRRILGEL